MAKKNTTKKEKAPKAKNETPAPEAAPQAAATDKPPTSMVRIAPSW